MNIEQWVKDRTHSYVRHGGKQHRKRVIELLIKILKEIIQAERGVCSPNQIGKAHIHRHYARHKHFADRTLQDRYYALKLFWELLKRSGNPPKPITTRSAACG